MSLASTAPTAAVPAHALRRGTRGFAAVVLFLTGMIVLAVTLFVLPSSALTRQALTIIIPLGIVFGIAHAVAIYGLIRRRAWATPLTLYLAAIGLGVAAFGGLLLVTGLDPLGRPGAEAALESRVQVLGLLLWLAGSWIVAARFAVRGMAPPEHANPEADDSDSGVVMFSHPRTGLQPSSA